MVFGPKKPDFSLSSELEFEEYAPQLRLLTPKLRSDAQVIPQKFCGKMYFVLQDPVTLQFYRVAETEREIIARLNGRTTLGEIHNVLKEKLGSQAPSFRELAHFVLTLRHANLTSPEASEEARWSVDRSTKKRHRKAKQQWSNFMYLTIPLLDPERFLNATIPYLRWVFSFPMFMVWLGVVGAAFVAFLYNAPKLLEPANSVLAPENLFMLWVAFFLIKTFHEFGHAYAAKAFGAEVHRMGVMFLIFMPCWYVDATPIWAFERKWPKVLVGSAGMMVELFLASFALLAWLVLEPGTLRSILYNVVFVASVSTVLFNGNPLLRYDAYYMLADLIELPNLRQRSSQYILYLAKKYLFGEKTPPAASTNYERFWFISYGILSTIYRTFVVVGIILYIASKLFFVGLAMAAAVAALWVATPLVKLIYHVFFAKETRQVRLRAVSVFSVLAAAVVYLVGIMPISTDVRTPCALEPHEERLMRAEWPGFLSQVHVKDGERVTQGQLLAETVNDELDFQIRRQKLRIDELRARLRRNETENQAAAQADAFQLSMIEKDLEMLVSRKNSLTFRAPFDGQLIAPDLDRVKGRFLQLGDELFTVSSLDKLQVTAVVDNADMAAIQQAFKQAPEVAVRIKFKSDASTVYEGRIDRLHPSATSEAPARTLTNACGGPVLLDPKSPDGRRTLLPWYRVDIRLDIPGLPPPPGATGQTRFIVGRDPIGKQAYLRFRRMLNRRFLV